MVLITVLLPIKILIVVLVIFIGPSSAFSDLSSAHSDPNNDSGLNNDLKVKNRIKSVKDFQESPFWVSYLLKKNPVNLMVNFGQLPISNEKYYSEIIP